VRLELLRVLDVVRSDRDLAEVASPSAGVSGPADARWAGSAVAGFVGRSVQAHEALLPVVETVHACDLRAGGT
jgi:hypothetical protein